MTTQLTPSPQITQLAPPSPHSGYFHVLPNLAVRDEPEVWRDVVKLLMGRGLSKYEALRRIRFAYTGSLTGELPPGIE